MTQRKQLRRGMTNQVVALLGKYRPTPRAALLSLLMLPVFASVQFSAYWLRFDGELTSRRWNQMLLTVVATVIIKSFAFYAFRIYQSWSRYFAFYDLVSLFQAATVSAVMLATYDYLFLEGMEIPRSVFAMDWSATIVVIGGLRSARRWFQEGQRLVCHPSGEPVLIVGANDYGEALLRAIRVNPDLKYHPVGFVAESSVRVGSFIGGVPIRGTVEQTCELALQHGVRLVLLAADDMTGKQVRELMDACSAEDIAVRVLPSYTQLLAGKVDLRPRSVSISDLLRRDPISLDTEKLHAWLDGGSVLVTGAAGSIGSEICRQLLQFAPRRLIVVDRSENGLFFLEKELQSLAGPTELQVVVADIADQRRMHDVFGVTRPRVVFHAAAYKHVPLMEHNCSEAIKNIPLATKVLADLSHEFDVDSFVMISTDKAVNPTSVMGASKRVAELYVQSLASTSACRFVTVRFGNVLGSAGSVVPIFKRQIDAGGPVTVTHPEMRRYFMLIPEASQLVIQAGAIGQGGEIMVLDMGEPVRIVDLATDMVRLSGLQLGRDIEIEFSGTRPGEKLFEELHVDGESHLPTSHPKIMVAACQSHDLASVQRLLAELQSVMRSGDDAIVQKLQQIVPQFQPVRFQTERRAA